MVASEKSNADTDGRILDLSVQQLMGYLRDF